MDAQLDVPELQAALAVAEAVAMPVAPLLKPEDPLGTTPEVGAVEPDAGPDATS